MTLLEQVSKTGRFPGLRMDIKPIEAGRRSITINSFLDYNFSSNIMIPVDAFGVSFKLPPDKKLKETVRGGDIVTLTCNNRTLATGIVDVIGMATSIAEERTVLQGRDLMSQLEDNAAVSIDQSPIFGSFMNIDDVIGKLQNNTRLRSKFINQNGPAGSSLFATNPGESKLSALQRYLEPMNCLAWMSPDGRIIIGRPAFDSGPVMTWKMRRTQRESNCFSMESTEASTQIPNGVTGVWTGCDIAQNAFRQSTVLNKAEGPARLRKAGHVVNHCLVISLPNVNDAQGKSDLSRFKEPTGFISSYVRQYIARANFQELQVRVTAPGHCDENGNPFLPDTTARIVYERAGIDEIMYCYGVDYSLSDRGQLSVLSFCRLNTIVADGNSP